MLPEASIIPITFFDFFTNPFSIAGILKGKNYKSWLKVFDVVPIYFVATVATLFLSVDAA